MRIFFSCVMEQGFWYSSASPIQFIVSYVHWYVYSCFLNDHRPSDPVSCSSHVYLPCAPPPLLLLLVAVVVSKAVVVGTHTDVESHSC